MAGECSMHGTLNMYTEFELVNQNSKTTSKT